MKLLAIAILLLLPLIWVLLFPSPKASSPDPTTVLAEDLAAKASPKAAEVALAHTATEKSDAQKHIAKMMEKTNLLGYSAAILMTEEVQRGMVERAVTRLERAYESLFSQWGLSDEERKAVLEITRAREARFVFLRTAAQKAGIEEVSKAKKVLEAERAGYATEISELLGPEKMHALAQVDDQEYEKWRARASAARR